MTFASRLLGGRKRLMLWVTIQGIARVFKERPVSVSALVLGEARPESACIPKGGIKIGAEDLDYEQLATVGGGLKLQLKQPRRSTILEDISRSQARRAAFLTDASVSKGAATFDVSTTVPFGAVDDTVTLYMGSETISARIASANTFDTAVRGKYGSRAQKHNGAGDDGTAVYDVPPSMLGRRVSLYASFLKDDGTTSSALTQQIGTYTIDENPIWKDDTLHIECGPILDEYLNRSCYVGLESVRAGTAYHTDDSGQTITLEVASARQFAVSIDGFNTFALVQTAGGRYFIGRVVSTDEAADPNTIELSLRRDMIKPPLIANERFSYDVADGKDGVRCSSVKHIAILGDALGAPLLQLLTSDLGDAAGANQFDRLPGRARTSHADTSPWRMGAAISLADVDQASIHTFGAQNWCWVLDESVKVKEFMRDWCVLAERFVYAKPAGQLASRPLSEERVASSMTLDDSVRVRSLPVETWVDEAAIYPQIRILGNYSPLDSEMKYRENHRDAELLQRFAHRDEPRVVSIRGLTVEMNWPQLPQHFVAPHPMGQEMVSLLGRRLQMANGRGRLVADVPCNLRALGLSVGDVVDIEVDGKDYNGGSIRGRVGRVVGKRPDPDNGRCDLRLHVLEDLFVFAPSGVVTALSTTDIANDTVTLSATDPANESATPTDNFGVGMKVRLWDRSAGTSQELTIHDIPNGTQLQFTAGVTGAIEADADWLTWSTLGQNVGVTSGNGDDEDDMMFMMADSGTPASGAVRRYR